jgi:chitin disaccharide deacetylase
MKTDIVLLVRADDIGSSQAANRACIEVYANGICRAVEVMTTCPWFPAAVQLLKKHPTYDVGVHLTLTSEWDGMKWGPLTQAPSLVGPDGYFCRSFWPGSSGETTFSDLDWKLTEVETELRTQIERAQENIPQVSHLSFHMGGTGADKRIEELYEALAREYGLQVDISNFEPFRGFGADSGTLSAAEKTERLAANLATLAPGKWIFVEHPAYDTPEMQAIGHAGYYHVASDRHGVTAAWTDEKIKALIDQRGIRLVSYADVKAATV